MATATASDGIPMSSVVAVEFSVMRSGQDATTTTISGERQVVAAAQPLAGYPSTSRRKNSAAHAHLVNADSAKNHWSFCRVPPKISAVADGQPDLAPAVLGQQGGGDQAAWRPGTSRKTGRRCRGGRGIRRGARGHGRRPAAVF